MGVSWPKPHLLQFLSSIVFLIFIIICNIYEYTYNINYDNYTFRLMLGILTLCSIILSIKLFKILYKNKITY